MQSHEIDSMGNLATTNLNKPASRRWPAQAKRNRSPKPRNSKSLKAFPQPSSIYSKRKRWPGCWKYWRWTWPNRTECNVSSPNAIFPCKIKRWRNFLRWRLKRRELGWLSAGWLWSLCGLRVFWRSPSPWTWRGRCWTSPRIYPVQGKLSTSFCFRELDVGNKLPTAHLVTKIIPYGLRYKKYDIQ